MIGKDSTKRGHAVALFSGGLDSALAILMIQKQNIEVTALTFLTHFGCNISDKSSCGGDPYPFAEKHGITVKLVHLGDKFIDIVKSPKYGYGKNMNPCVDCRILMLRQAKLFMELIDADFVITGEVLGQRPKSQLRNSLNTVNRESDLNGRLVRPLSAKLLDETDPEKSGLLNREELGDISGRSRKIQLAMAKEFGLTSFSSPSGGCLLTDPQYSMRLRDLLNHSDKLDFKDINLLRAGRHFRINKECKIIVGRDEQDNNRIEENARPEYIKLEAIGTGSPITLFIGEKSQSNIELAAAITARYCDLKNEPRVKINCSDNNVDYTIDVVPARPDDIIAYQIK
jgi:tRNA U34 2-thiouridine synthase MnmA/TrmU